MHGYERDCTGVATARRQAVRLPRWYGVPLRLGLRTRVPGRATRLVPHHSASPGSPQCPARAGTVPGRIGQGPLAPPPISAKTSDAIAQTSGGADRARGSSMGPVAPVAAAPGRVARAGATDHGGTHHEAADSDTAEPMTWAQLAVHDQVRATPGPATTDPGHSRWTDPIMKGEHHADQGSTSTSAPRWPRPKSVARSSTRCNRSSAPSRRHHRTVAGTWKGRASGA